MRGIRYLITVIVLHCVTIVAVVKPAHADYVGLLQTPASSGVIGGGNWTPPTGGSGYRVSWLISENVDNTWHYEYTFHTQAGTSLMPLTSHVIFQLSENAGANDLFNFTGDILDVEFGTYGPSTGNPGFPIGETIFGIKINLANKQEHIAFDSIRIPMWGDFYSKAGGTANPSYAYNVDLGTPVVNPHDIDGTPVDEFNNPLFKIPVPNSQIPEPASLGAILAGIIGLLRVSRRRR